MNDNDWTMQCSECDELRAKLATEQGMTFKAMQNMVKAGEERDAQRDLAERLAGALAEVLPGAKHAYDCCGGYDAKITQGALDRGDAILVEWEASKK